MGDYLYDPSLYLLSMQLDAVEGLRKATENRLRQATRDVQDKDGEVRGFGLPENDPGVASMTRTLEGLQSMEAAVIKDLQKSLRAHPLYAWCRKTVGVGEKQFARLLSVIGDPYWHALYDRPRTVSELWAYCGLHTLPEPAGRAPDQTDLGDHMPHVRGAARRKKGQQANWSTQAKTRAYLIAESCIKQAHSPYRLVYDQRRRVTAEKIHDRPCPQCNGAGKTQFIESPWRPGHQQADALRIVSKRILKDIWVWARDWYRAQEESG